MQPDSRQYRRNPTDLIAAQMMMQRTSDTARNGVTADALAGLEAALRYFGLPSAPTGEPAKPAEPHTPPPAAT